MNFAKEVYLQSCRDVERQCRCYSNEWDMSAAYYIHPLADCQTKNIGTNTKIWQFTIVLPKASIGDNCNISSHCFIENDVIIGNNVTVKCGVYIWDGLRIEDKETFEGIKRGHSYGASSSTQLLGYWIESQAPGVTK